MDMLAALVEIAKDLALPLGVALITARVTLRAGRQQIRAQTTERNENREHEQQKRRENLETTALKVRSDAIEAISDCIDQYTEDVRNQKTPTTVAVARSLFRLSTRCSAEHLADTCRSYVEDSARAPDPGHAIDAMTDIRRRLIGWHIGHLTLEATERLIREGHEEILNHLALQHQDHT